MQSVDVGVEQRVSRAALRGGIRIGRVRNRDGREDIRAQFGSPDGKLRDCRALVLKTHTPETDRDGIFSEDFVRLVIKLEKTPLMAFFEYNTDHHSSRQHLYQDFPSHFTWNSKDQEWHPRIRGFQIGRMYQGNPFQRELYYLRCLLTVRSEREVRGIWIGIAGLLSLKQTQPRQMAIEPLVRSLSDS
jgi:hypothetical protein